MKLSDFDFDLPERLIAVRPAVPRTAARLLLAENGVICDRSVSDLIDILRPGDRLVLNNTKVIPARLNGIRIRQTSDGQTTRAKIETTLLNPMADGHWRCLLKPLKKIKEGETITFAPELTATLVTKEDGQGIVAFNVTGDAFDQALAKAGSMPLPPYIAAKRQADEQDKSDYQTVFACETGAVAAPTASLHFDKSLLGQLRDKGIQFSEVTLHVGAGTFLPVKVDDISKHKMHAEWGQVTERAASDIAATKAAGGRVIPVGTTALRLIETAAQKTGRIQSWTGETDIFITPGFAFKVTDALMTNFHLPKSTLMMLVSALMTPEEIKRIYAHAISGAYRFFSYGDASLLIPKTRND